MKYVTELAKTADFNAIIRLNRKTAKQVPTKLSMAIYPKPLNPFVFLVSTTKAPEKYETTKAGMATSVNANAVISSDFKP